jgi:hypothetical protein
MSKRKLSRRLRAVMFADAINKIEGVPVSAEAELLSARWVRGEITGEEMVAALVKKHSRTQSVSSNERPVSA